MLVARTRCLAVNTVRTLSCSFNLTQFKRTNNARTYSSASSSFDLAINQPVSFAFSDTASTLLCDLHQLSGQNWYVDIIIATCALKTFVTLPLTIWREKQLYKYNRSQLDLFGFTEMKLKELKPLLDTGEISRTKAMVEFRNKKKVEKFKLIQKYNCHPGKRIVSIIGESVPYVSFFFALKNLCLLSSEHLEQMMVQGTFWFPNLVSPDVYYGLPVLVGLTMLANSELHARYRRRNGIPDTFLAKCITNGMRLASPVMILVCSYLPSAVAVYWLTSGMGNLTVTYLLNQRWFRSIFKIPNIYELSLNAKLVK